MMRLQMYEITFAGQAGSTPRGMDDCEVAVGPDTTTLAPSCQTRQPCPGLVLRITGLEVIDMHLVTSPAEC